MRRTCFAILVLAGTISLARADDEASNVPQVTASQYGRCYAKSVPAERSGSKGSTKIYVVQPGEDSLRDTFSWYSNRIYLECGVGRANQHAGTSVVQFGPWARGSRAAADDLALAFHFAGKLVRRYSTLDIAGSPDNVSSSVSHYTVIERVEGYRWKGSNFSVFEVVTTDGRRLTFDPTTGEILSEQSTRQ